MRRLDSADFGLGNVMGWDEATVKASLQVHHAKDGPDPLTRIQLVSATHRLVKRGKLR